MIRLSKLLEADLGAQDTPAASSESETKQIYDKLGYDFDFAEFVKGMEVEQEHKDVTGGDLELTAKIAAAHLREVPNYYTLLKKYVEK